MKPTIAHHFQTSAAISLAAILLAGCAAIDAPQGPRIYPVLSEPSHQHIFHNDLIDVYQVRLQAGEGTYYHHHSHDQLAISMSAYTGAGQVLGKDEQIASATQGVIVYIPHSAIGGTTHRVRAVRGEMWVIGIEFTEPALPGTTMAWAAPDAPRLEFPQGHIDRLRLAPGEHAAIKGDLILPMTAGALQVNASGPSWTFKAGQLKWVGATAADYRNTGAEAVDLLALDLN